MNPSAPPPRTDRSSPEDDFYEAQLKRAKFCQKRALIKGFSWGFFGLVSLSTAVWVAGRASPRIEQWNWRPKLLFILFGFSFGFWVASENELAHCSKELYELRRSE